MATKNAMRPRRVKLSELAHRQYDFCRKNRLTMLMANSGYCHNCGAELFDNDGIWGYFPHEAGTVYITECKYCKGAL